jgi:hypothetical protein
MTVALAFIAGTNAALFVTSVIEGNGSSFPAVLCFLSAFFCLAAAVFLP